MLHALLQAVPILLWDARLYDQHAAFLIHHACSPTIMACIPYVACQVLMAVDKDRQGNISTEALMDVGYVPLTRPYMRRA